MNRGVGPSVSMEIGLLIVVVIAIVEIFLSGAFVPFYFTIGIPIFGARFAVAPAACLRQ